MLQYFIYRWNPHPSSEPCLPSNRIDNQMSMDSEIHSFILTNCCTACQSINHCHKFLFRSLDNLPYTIPIICSCVPLCVFSSRHEPYWDNQSFMRLIFDLCPEGYCLFQSIKQKQSGPFDPTLHGIWETKAYWYEKLWPNLRPKTCSLTAYLQNMYSKHIVPCGLCTSLQRPWSVKVKIYQIFMKKWGDDYLLNKSLATQGMWFRLLDNIRQKVTKAAYMKY